MTGYSEFIGLSPQSGAILDHLNSSPEPQKPLFSSLSPGLSMETSISSTKSSVDITEDDKLVAPAQTLTANQPQASCHLLFVPF